MSQEAKRQTVDSLHSLDVGKNTDVQQCHAFSVRRNTGRDPLETLRRGNYGELTHGTDGSSMYFG